MASYPARPETLELFKMETCPFCQRVMGWIDSNWSGSPAIERRDINREPEARATLETVGGKVQVPCLFVDGVPMYESGDIIAYLAEINAA